MVILKMLDDDTNTNTQYLDEKKDTIKKKKIFFINLH